MTFTPGARAHVRILADADDRANVSVAGNVVGKDKPTQVPIGTPIAL